jgi:drug/metabolite transporter (DMT)-like permease
MADDSASHRFADPAPRPVTCDNCILAGTVSAVLSTSPLAPVRWRGLVSRAGQGDQTLVGILLVVVSTVFLSGSDALSKNLAAGLPAIEIAWLRYVGFTAIMLVMAIASPERRLPATRRPGLQILRGIGLVGSSVLFITSLRYLPVAAATAISFVSPIFVTALSIPFLGEKVGVRRWAAALAGLTGVLIIIRPGTGAFQAASLLPIASALFWAAGLIATRKLGHSDPARTTMTYSALVGLVILSAMVPAVWATPSWDQLLIGAGIGIVSTIGHWIVTVAYRHADASVLVPFSYTQIIWATLFSIFVFTTMPDHWTFFGAGVVVGSGLYTAHRERLRSRAAATDALTVSPGPRA